MTDWIRVEDRLPGYIKRCLVVYEGAVQHSTPYLVRAGKEKDYWYFDEDVDDLAVDAHPTITHWMPLPKPPK